MKRIGIPIIISAPSGAGKTSLVKALVERMPKLQVSVSHITRAKRPSEVDGINYHFIDKSKFESMIKQDEFIEYAQVFDNYYGTSKAWLQKQLDAGMDVILEIDWQGAKQIRSKLPNSISIFILPPSLPVLAQRLQARGQDDDSVIAKRMQQAQDEISHYHEFDFLVVNDDFESAVEDLMAILRAQHLARQNHRLELTQLLANLLA